VVLVVVNVITKVQVQIHQGKQEIHLLLPHHKVNQEANIFVLLLVAVVE
jgi:hypothetical protein